MADYFTATSEDGVRFKLNQDGTWAPDITTISNECIQFRSSNWGDNIAQVKSEEAVEPIHETDAWLMYETQIAGFPVNLSFRFISGMLKSGFYHFKQEHSDNNDFIFDFETLNKLLTIKYGAPNETKDYWFNDMFRDDYSRRGMAIASGHHSRYFLWSDEQTTLTLQLRGDNYEIYLSALYESKSLKPLADAADEREKLVGL